MNLDAIFYLETQKALDFLLKTLEDEKLKENEEQIHICLHTLKGDLNYLQDISLLWDLSLLKQKVKKELLQGVGSSGEALDLTLSMKRKLESFKSASSSGLESDLGFFLKTIVQNAAKTLGKRIDFSWETNIDSFSKEKFLLLKDLLTPLVINSCVHGIESPQTRRQRGKNETGRTRALVKHENGRLRIEVDDDGAGPLQENLYKPKGEDDRFLKELYAGEKIGVQRVRALVAERGGSFALSGEAGKSFKIEIVLDKEKSPAKKDKP